MEWARYCAGLAEISDPRAAQRFADRGPTYQAGDDFYHNLGCYLHGNPLRNPGADEWAEILKYVQRAEAAGIYLAGTAAALEHRIERERASDRRG